MHCRLTKKKLNSIALKRVCCCCCCCCLHFVDIVFQSGVWCSWLCRQSEKTAITQTSNAQVSWH